MINCQVCDTDNNCITSEGDIPAQKIITRYVPHKARIKPQSDCDFSTVNASLCWTKIKVGGTCDLLLNNRTGPKWGTSSLGLSHVTEDAVLSQACRVPDWLWRSKLPCCRLREQARGQKPGQCLRAGGGLQPRALTQSHNKSCNMLSEVGKRDSRWELSSGQHTDCGLAGGTVYPQKLVYNRSVWA